MVRAAVQQAYLQLPLKPLKLLTQGRLHDVLPVSCPAEMQLLSQGHEIAKLAKLHARLHLADNANRAGLRSRRGYGQRRLNCPRSSSMSQEHQAR